MLVFKIIPYLKKYDIIHVHLFPAQYWVVFAKIISFSKTKLIFTEHNTSNRRLEKPVFRFIDKLIYKFYAKVVCITVEIKAILVAHTKLSAKMFQVIENGVNLNSIKNANAINKKSIDASLQEDDKLIIQIAGFRKQKDQKTAIEAMTILPKPYKLILVGVGPLKTECETLVVSLGLQNRVLFLGVRMDVPQLLKTADVVLLSSKYEGLSLSNIEGMASGKPFVASNVPGLREVVQGAGILFPVGNAEQLAIEISKLISNTKHYNDVATACQQRAEAYNIHKMVDQHINLYNSFAKN
jgi:glycosyltransferase involved in cell wall biosynthesis